MKKINCYTSDPGENIRDCVTACMKKSRTTKSGEVFLIFNGKILSIDEKTKLEEKLKEYFKK